MSPTQPTDFSTDPRRRARGRRGRWKAATAIIVAAIGAGATITVAALNAPPSHATSGGRAQIVSAAHARPDGSITIPENGDVITAWPTTSVVQGVLTAPLEPGHTLYFATRQIDEQGWHPARTPCTVVDLRFTCAVLYLGERNERHDSFRLELWDVDESATSALGAFAERAVSDNSAIPLPSGVRVLDDELLHRG